MRDRAWVLVLVAAAALSLDAQGPLYGLAPYLAVVGLGAAIAASVARGLVRGLAVRAARAEARLRRVARRARDLAGTADEAVDRAGADLAARAEADAHRVAAWKQHLAAGAWRRVEAVTEGCERLAADRQAELAALEGRLTDARAELTATAAYLDEVGRMIDALCVRTDGTGRLWCDDLRARLGEAERALGATRGTLDAGAGPEALREGRRLRGRLADVQRTLAARQASLGWLEGLGAEAAALDVERRRLAAAGHRDLPPVPADRLVRDAEAAVKALLSGDLGEAKALENGLRDRYEGLRRAVTGREDLRRATEGRLDAARAALARLQEGLAGTPAAEVRKRFPPEVYASPARLEDRLVARLRGIDMTLRQAAQANHLDAGAFEEAAGLLGEAEAALAVAAEEAVRSAAAWRLPLDEEARLSRRLASIHGDVGAAYATSRAHGHMPGSGLEGLLTAARLAMHGEVVDLAAAARTLNEIEATLARMGEHLEAERRAVPGPVTMLPEQAADALVTRRSGR